MTRAVPTSPSTTDDDALIRAVGGEDAVSKVRQILTQERGQRGGGGAPPATG